MFSVHLSARASISESTFFHVCIKMRGSSIHTFRYFDSVCWLCLKIISIFSRFNVIRRQQKKSRTFICPVSFRLKTKTEWVMNNYWKIPTHVSAFSFFILSSDGGFCFCIHTNPALDGFREGFSFSHFSLLYLSILRCTQSVESNIKH